MNTKNSNIVVFVGCVICAVVVVLCAGFYFWHLTSWQDDTVVIRESIKEEEKKIEELKASIEQKKEEAFSQEEAVKDSEAQLANSLLNSDNWISTDLEFVYTAFKSALDSSSYANGDEVIDCARVFSNSNESFVRNFVPFPSLFDDDGPTYVWIDFVDGVCLEATEESRKYLGAVYYNLGYTMGDFKDYTMYFYFTVNGTGGSMENLSLSIGDCFMSNSLLMNNGSSGNY